MRLLITALFFYASLAHATETVRWKVLPNGSLSFWALHSESDLYVIDRFEKKPGEFQDLREHLAFSTLEKARAALNLRAEGYKEGTPPLLLLRSGGVNRTVAGEIWPTRESWSWSWEKKFAEWVSEETNAGYFRKYGISTDCADAAYAFRFIFARIHGLPAAHHLSVSKDLFSNESVLPQWSNLPTASRWHEDARFRAALDYLLRNTYTHSLMDDLYPVKISKEATLPGTIFLHLYSAETGHTEWLYQVKGATHPSPLRILASNVPREVRDLAEYGMLDWGSQPLAGRDGLLRFRWPVRSGSGWSLVSGRSMPNYSLEQYEQGFLGNEPTFVDAVVKKILPNWAPDAAGVMKEKTNLLKDRFLARVKIVNDGYQTCQAKGGCREGSGDWENWSTPSRDGAILRLVEEVMGLSNDDLCKESCLAVLRDARAFTISNIGGSAYTLGNGIDVWQEGRFKSDPNLPPAERWGR